jgi:hypothetical protein
MNIAFVIVYFFINSTVREMRRSSSSTKMHDAAYMIRLALLAPKSSDVTLTCSRDDFVLGCITLLQKYLILLIVDGNIHVQTRAIEAIITYFDLLLGKFNSVISLEKEKEDVVRSLIGNLAVASASKFAFYLWVFYSPPFLLNCI